MTTGGRVCTLTAATARPPPTLSLQWSDGTPADIDLHTTPRGHIARALPDKAEFVCVNVGEWYDIVESPCDSELSAHTLWLETASVSGRDDAPGFLEWRLPHGLPLIGVAQALGLSRRMIAHYSNGDTKITCALLLVCKRRGVDQPA